jgi:phosphoribosyl-ATP pyrophosphohydrolase/phosphoribosyl-AMP cyclohydrolase
MDIKFNESGLVPVITVDYFTNEVLMLAYADSEAVNKTIETKRAHYYSRSRKKLWLKGETSGNYQYVRQIRSDCDDDTLMYLVEQKGSACHTGERSCFFKKLYTGDGYEDTKRQDGSYILNEVYDVIVDRSKNPKEGSYTTYLFEKGIDKILKKVGEEAAETIIAAKNDSKKEIVLEVSDLLYHLMVMLAEKNIKLDDIYKELEGRR